MYSLCLPLSDFTLSWYTVKDFLSSIAASPFTVFSSFGFSRTASMTKSERMVSITYLLVAQCLAGGEHIFRHQIRIELTAVE